VSQVSRQFLAAEDSSGIADGQCEVSVAACNAPVLRVVASVQKMMSRTGREYLVSWGADSHPCSREAACKSALMSMTN
nr:hypothetical protein [Tanacetum cinerariifolium]